MCGVGLSEVDVEKATKHLFFGLDGAQPSHAALYSRVSAYLRPGSRATPELAVHSIFGREDGGPVQVKQAPELDNREVPLLPSPTSPWYIDASMLCAAAYAGYDTVRWWPEVDVGRPFGG